MRRAAAGRRPAAPAAACRRGPMPLSVRGARAAATRGPAGRSTGSISTSPRAGAWPSSVPAAPASPRSPVCCCASSPYPLQSVTLDGVEIAELDGDEYRRAVGLRRTGRPRLRHHARGEPAPGPPRRRRTQELRAALAAARLLAWADALPAGLATEAGERGIAPLGRPTPAARARPRPARRLPGARPRRAGGAPRHRDGRCDRRRSARSTRGSDDAADHTSARRAGGRRRGDGARPGPRGRTRHPRRARSPLGGRYAELYRRERRRTQRRRR